MHHPPSILLIANFSPGAGYAWARIERMFERVAQHFAQRGVVTFVGYPNLRGLDGSAYVSAVPVALDASLVSAESRHAVEKFVRDNNVQVLYLTDRRPWDFTYREIHHSGVRRIIVHTRTVVGWRRRSLPWRSLKTLLAATPGVRADVIVAVSDFVARRIKRVAGVVPRRVVRVWNSPIGQTMPREQRSLHRRLELPPDTPILICIGRASPEKGIDVLFRAFDRLVGDGITGAPPPALAYFGDGPHTAALTRLRARLEFGGGIHMLGYEPAAAAYIDDALFMVVPSTGPEAFGNVVLESMVRGRAVVASNIGGIPELVADGVNGILVPPGGVDDLATAMKKLLMDRPLCAAMGEAGRQRALADFQPEANIRAICDIIEPGLTS